MHDIKYTLSPSTYNHQPALERTNDYVRAHGLVDLIEDQLRAIFLDHKVHDFWALYLLHHHWAIDEGEIPGEDPRPGVPTEYVMRPIAQHLTNQYLPSVISFAQPTEIQALEFSRSKFTASAYAILQRAPAFLRDVGGKLRSMGLNERFGLCAVRSPSTPNHRWVEYTEDYQRASVMKEMRVGDFDESDMIQTSWAFSEETYGTRCRGSCHWKCSNCYSPDRNHSGHLG